MNKIRKHLTRKIVFISKEVTFHYYYSNDVQTIYQRIKLTHEGYKAEWKLAKINMDTSSREYKKTTSADCVTASSSERYADAANPSIVCRINKKGNLFDSANYREISLLSIAYKIVHLKPFPKSLRFHTRKVHHHTNIHTTGDHGKDLEFHQHK